MGEEENRTEVPEVTANGTSAPAKENSNDVMTEKTEENNGIKEMEEDKNDSEKVEIARMDEDPKVTEERESKDKEDGLEEGRTEAMEEEIKPKVDEEMEGKEKEAKEEVEEKVDVSKEKEEVEQKVDVSKEKEEVEEKDGGSKEKQEKLEEEDGERSKQRGKRKSDGRKAEMKKVMEEKKEPEGLLLLIGHSVKENLLKGWWQLLTKMLSKNSRLKRAEVSHLKIYLMWHSSYQEGRLMIHSNCFIQFSLEGEERHCRLRVIYPGSLVLCGIKMRGKKRVK
uniref:Uncharacterized protein n=1 Tax=Populus trichocarpa TaxID=3694 RepID=A0A3N7FSY0_POPTR